MGIRGIGRGEGGSVGFVYVCEERGRERETDRVRLDRDIG